LKLLAKNSAVCNISEISFAVRFIGRILKGKKPLPLESLCL
jgi:hypothetical protein